MFPQADDPRVLAERLAAEVETLRARKADLEARMPAHSVSPAMMQELEDLEEQLASAERRLADARRRSM